MSAHEHPKRRSSAHRLLLPHSGEVVVQGVVLWWGAVDHYLGLAATVLGRWDEAESWLRAGLRTHEAWAVRAISLFGESGIGLATARLFVAEGARVHILGLDEGRLEDAERELGANRCGYTVADVTDEAAVAAALDVAAGAGPLDVVFSNAGISGAVSQLVDYPSGTFARTLAVHVLGGFHMIKHALPQMRDGGSIIITSSVVGLMGFAGISGYVAAKHGQVGLMRAAAKEAESRRIRVNTLHPGPTSTAFQDESVLYLAGDDSRFVTGTTLTVDGGLRG